MKNLLINPKPRLGEACNGCGYCCTVEPCLLAKEFLHCITGPCYALESSAGRSRCGLVRNPLGYLFKAANPTAEVDLLAAPAELEEGYRLSVAFAAALGVGQGCDAEDTAESTCWPSSARIPTHNF